MSREDRQKWKLKMYNYWEDNLEERLCDHADKEIARLKENDPGLRNHRLSNRKKERLTNWWKKREVEYGY